MAGEVVITPDVRVLEADGWAERAAEVVGAAIREALASHGACHIGLAGGSTPHPVYEQLAARDDIDWTRVTFYFGDERAVGPDDDASNYRMARQAFGGCFERATVERIEGEREPEDARAEYERRLDAHPIHVLLLGMGDDGHTASLFPGDAQRDARARVVLGTSPVPPTARISLSARAINDAEAVFLLVRGAGKAARLAEVHAQLAEPAPTLPAAWVRPSSGRLVWLTDSAAAANLAPKDDR